MFICSYSIQFDIILKSQRCDFFIDFIVILFGDNCIFFLLIFIMSLLVYVCQSVDHIIFVKYLALETFFLMIVFFNFPIQSMLDDFVKQTVEFIVAFVFWEIIFFFIIVPDCKDNFDIRSIFWPNQYLVCFLFQDSYNFIYRCKFIIEKLFWNKILVLFFLSFYNNKNEKYY